ncbi:MAG: O-antigen ligase family protein [Euryarchaeota archaeon]|nr:O-antigen ligase family protein [Euryarchaeota archaeon]
MRILIILAIILIPFAGLFNLGFESIWFPQYLAFLLFLGLCASFQIWRFNKYISLFTILCLFSTVFITQFNPRAFVLLSTFYACIFCSIKISTLDDKTKKLIINSIIALMILQGIWTFVQWLNICPQFKIGNTLWAPFFKAHPRMSQEGFNTYPVGFSGSYNQLGAFSAITFPIALGNSFLILTNIFCLLVAHSTFGILATIGSILFYSYFKGGKFFFKSLLIICSFLLIFMFTVDKFKKADFIRLYVWKHAIKSTITGKIELANTTIKSIPLMGFGFGSFMLNFPYIPQEKVDNKFNYSTEKFAHAHNDYIEAFYELGILAWVIIMLFLRDLFIRIKKIKNKSENLIKYGACFFAYIINAFGNFTSQIALNGLVIVIIYGLLEGEIKNG